MKLLVISFFILLMASCTSREDETVQIFEESVHNLDLEKVQSMCTEDTRFYFKVAIEPLFKFSGRTELNSVKKIALSLTCTGEGRKRNCSYLDSAGEIHTFELSLVEDFEELGSSRLLIDIERKYFFKE
ncbi:hypothetical protein Oweho_0007 [Owenweeksia hongkongensis DSM 17368]|uniref:Lipoprotein n=1 Tax=Owenweeksia hongkongensis (strain DSM 17368 / CIP 108786 / JCM 12287 / NRRL B-23963 / UST20020801) TaxID=926562 RepID=G8R523_OWEHD|nr:hypothetical protein [Owenweeksia hongkongensis]AEV31034.1 hypothetical protein Oweho_0007 [Owenweeksia hongkongensis DSM 17368]